MALRVLRTFGVGHIFPTHSLARRADIVGAEWSRRNTIFHERPESARTFLGYGCLKLGIGYNRYSGIDNQY